MLQSFLPLFGFVALSLLPSPAFSAESVPVSSWEPRMGDVFVVDVAMNTGTLVHADGETLSFPVATGRKGYVSYIGRYYKAETPVRTWTAEQFQIKGDRRTFGASGRFIRLFRSGESSPYGIHPYYKPDQWMEAEGRYFSMGCILVTEEIMDVMEKTFAVNDKKMIVITTDNAEKKLTEMHAEIVAMK